MCVKYRKMVAKSIIHSFKIFEFLDTHYVVFSTKEKDILLTLYEEIRFTNEKYFNEKY